MKSGDAHSFLYDNQFLLSITVNGQLMLAMLIDKFIKIPNIKILQTNTDGISVMISKIYENDLLLICKEWEQLTKLQLEYAYYKKMVIKDVNNYLAVYTNNKVKYKGLFEIEKDYHKDNSFKIIPIALSNYFVNSIPIETTINNHTNIYDFCGRVKAKAGMHYKLHYVKDKKYIEEKQQKNIRYYISNDGGRLLKYYSDGRTSDVHVRSKVTIANKIEKDKKYNNINHNFYIKECYKIIDQIIPLQQKLF